MIDSNKFKSDEPGAPEPEPVIKEVNLTGGDWKLKAAGENEYSYGIYSEVSFDLNVTGGSLTATGTKGAVGLENGCKITVNLPNDYVLLLDDEFKIGTPRIRAEKRTSSSVRVKIIKWMILLKRPKAVQ